MVCVLAGVVLNDLVNFTNDEQDRTQERAKHGVEEAVVTPEVPGRRLKALCAY